MLTDLAASFFPATLPLHIEHIAIEPQCVTLQASSTQTTSQCPECGQSAHRIHSRYERTLRDLPWIETIVQIRLQVRRFFCDQESCVRTTFAERFPELVVPYARRTQRVTHAQRKVALALGGAAGARLATALQMPVSRNTLLRLLRRVPQRVAAPRVIGIDDWAQRKGQTYGTIIVDLERHEPIDLLPDRSVESVAAWLHAHPSVEVVSRDRGEPYIAGVTAWTCLHEGMPLANSATV
jgi:transposase